MLDMLQSEEYGYILQKPDEIAKTTIYAFLGNTDDEQTYLA
jgi:hypothetical protein